MALLATLLAALGGCAGGPGVVVRNEPPPPYAVAAARYNERIAPLRTLIGQVTGTVVFTEQGKPRHEEFSGVLQLAQPDKVALSIKKVGQRVAWIGGDAQRAWLIQFGDEPTALVGSHEAFTRALAGEGEGDAQAGGGLAPIAPRDLAALIGVAPLPEGGVGATQWSANGRLLGLTVRLDREEGGSGGLRRTWVDPETFVARRVEVFDAGRRVQFISELEGEGRVSLSESTGARPRLPERVTITHVPSGSLLTLGIGAMRDGPVEPEAFDFAELLDRFGVQRVEHLADDAVAANP
jgi:hypothetical protein